MRPMLTNDCDGEPNAWRLAVRQQRAEGEVSRETACGPYRD